jgi:hypothetical protein
MKKILFMTFTMFTFAFAAPLELEGGALYIEAPDTTLTFDAPDDGMIFVGYVIKGDGMGWGVHLIIDQDTLMHSTKPDGGSGVNSESNTLAVSISKGNHTISIQKPLGSSAVITHSRIWVLFWPKKTVAVVEGPSMPPVLMLASLCRAGIPVSVPSKKASIYDASGKLVERPSSSWTPTEAGTYFVQAEKQVQKVTVVK